jgi:predicted  nucleic acid-binding Zn-ribbon protein
VVKSPEAPKPAARAEQPKAGSTKSPSATPAVPPPTANRKSQTPPPKDQVEDPPGRGPGTKDKKAIAAAAVAAKTAAAEKSAVRRPILAQPAVLITLLVLFVGIAAVSVYYFTRETRLTLDVASGDIAPNPEAHIVFNFAGKIHMLRRDYQNRQQPLIQQVDDQQLQLISARGDLAGRQQRKKLLDDALAQYQKEIPEILRQGQAALDRFWNQEGEALKAEYRNTLEALHKEIADKAQSLGIAYARNPELDAIEVAANAYRLALYNAPSGIKVDDERKWVEEILARWKKFEVEWTERQLQLRDKAMAIKQQPGPKVAAAEERIASLRQEIDALAIELQALESEVATYERRLQDAQEALEATIRPFMQELLNVPGQFEQISLQLPPSGPLVLRDLQERTDLVPGSYTLLVRGTRDGQEYWAVKEFTIAAYKKNTASIQPQDFVPARSFLLPKEN